MCINLSNISIFLGRRSGAAVEDGLGKMERSGAAEKDGLGKMERSGAAEEDSWLKVKRASAAEDGGSVNYPSPVYWSHGK